ncbi:hypothetical protein O9929_06590 [Vibrio lentus]|nr:hypothetical protein [Vibrio lentus]
MASHLPRLDVKFKDMHSLMNGERTSLSFEVNGASSEAAQHLIVPRPRGRDIFYAILHSPAFFLILALNRNGMRPPASSFKSLFNAWQEERRLVQQYPTTD